MRGCIDLDGGKRRPGQDRGRLRPAVLESDLQRILGRIDLRPGAGHFVSFFIKGARERAFEVDVLPVGADHIVNFDLDAGTFDGGRLGFYAEDALIDVVKCRGEGSVGSGSDMPGEVEGDAICVDEVPCQSPASLAWAEQKGVSVRAATAKIESLVRSMRFHESPCREGRFRVVQRTVKTLGGTTSSRMVRRMEHGSSKIPVKAGGGIRFGPPGFPHPAEAPTIGLLWAKRRKKLFRWHAPIAGR